MLIKITKENKFVMCVEIHSISSETVLNCFQKNIISGNKNVISTIKNAPDYSARNELEYTDLLVDGKRVKYLKDSALELIFLRKYLFPNKSSSGYYKLRIALTIHSKCSQRPFPYNYSRIKLS